MSKINHYDKSAIERGSVRFNRVGKTEFWMTLTNRIFIIHQGHLLTPTLRGSQAITFDNLNVSVPPDVAAECLRLLRKQREIREGLDWKMRPEEDEAAYTYTNE